MRSYFGGEKSESRNSNSGSSTERAEIGFGKVCDLVGMVKK